MPREGRTSVFFLAARRLWTRSDAELFTFWTVEDARVTPRKGRGRPLPAPICTREGEKGRDREMWRRGTEEDRKWVDRHGNEERYFSQVDQIQPCTGARHKKINRKELFLIPWLKLLIYLKTIEWQIWNSQGKGIFGKPNRFISILKAKLWFSGNTLRNQVVLRGFIASEQSNMLNSCWGALGHLEQNPTTL